MNSPMILVTFFQLSVTNALQRIEKRYRRRDKPVAIKNATSERFPSGAVATHLDVAPALPFLVVRPNPRDCSHISCCNEASRHSGPSADAAARAAGSYEILTSVRSTTSHGSSPSRHSQSRKPAYSFAECRVSHATLLPSGKRPSSHARSGSSVKLFQSGWPSSLSTHFARNERSEGLIGPKLISSKEAITSSSRPAFLNACTRQPAPDAVKTK